MKYNHIWVTGKLAPVSIKLHIRIYEINGMLLLKTQCKPPSSVCNFRLGFNVAFGYIMRQKYVPA